MTFTNEILSGKTNAELCEILASLGGTPPASGKFRTKAQGIKQILELAETHAETPGELPAPKLPLLRELPGFSKLNAHERRSFRRNLRRARRNRNERKRLAALRKVQSMTERLAS